MEAATMSEDDFVIAYRAISYQYLNKWVQGFIKANGMEKGWDERDSDLWTAALVTSTIGIMANWAASWTPPEEIMGDEVTIKLMFELLTDAFTKSFVSDMDVIDKLGKQT
jgi:hypothetical protein